MKQELSIKRVLSTLKFDILFQFRHGFYYVYMVVSALYIAVLINLPEGIKESFATLLVFSDTSVMGFFFIGGLILLEKDQKTLGCLFVTPLRMLEYFISKTMSLTVLSLIMSFVIVTFSFGTSFNPIMLFTGVVLSSIFFTLLGFAIAARSKSVNGYLIKASLFMIVFFAPIIDYFNLVKTPLFFVFPTKASLILIDAAFKGFTPLEVVYSLAAFCIWISIAWIWSNNWFYKYVILRIGEG